MFDFLSRKGTAAHLAILAVAPLVLLSVAGESMTAVVTLWLAGFSALWAFMSPSVRDGENSVSARRRVLSGVMHDPVAWVLLLVLLIAAVRAFNGGVSAHYNAEEDEWLLAAPFVSVLPGCVSGSGLLPFAAVVAAIVIYIGVAHSLDAEGSADFAFLAAMFAALRIAAKYLLPLAGFSYDPEPTVADGLWMLVSGASIITLDLSRRRFCEFLSMASFAGSATALVTGSKLVVAAGFGVAFLVFLVAAYALRYRELWFMGHLRTFLMLLVAIAIPSIILYDTIEQPIQFFPEGYREFRAVLGRIAIGGWRAHPWTGAGIGSFPQVIRFGASASDWSIIGVTCNTAANGWWQLLAERGVIGALSFALVGCAVMVQWVRILLDRELLKVPTAGRFLVPVAFAVLGAAALVDVSFMRADAILAVVSIAAISINGGK